MKALRAEVHGVVQGVGFRFFVEREAKKLGLTGYVRNKPDGTVEAVASGSESVLREFLEKLNRGPSFSRVSRVETEWLEVAQEFKSFTIRF
ncbi:MAG: acylphosphatase [bacterium]